MGFGQTPSRAPSSATVSLPVPSDFRLPRDACSYGYFLLDPNDWDPASGTFTTTLQADGRAVTVRVTQPDGTPGSSLHLRPDAQLSASARQAIRKGLARMLRLDESAATIAEFHAVDARFSASGRGRVMRSPSFFEDVIKTVTSCNVTWPSTIIMNRRLCEIAGEKSASGLFAFPTPERLARTRPQTLRARCSVGYRDARIVELARMFVRGEINVEQLSDPRMPDQELYNVLIEWPGIGPYAAANIMQLLGRYGRLPLDTESVRHGRTILGFKGTPARIMKRVHKHFAPFGEHAFRSYWFELWEFYERKRGPSWTWERRTTGKTFTAAKMNEADWSGETPPDSPSLARKPVRHQSRGR